MFSRQTMPIPELKIGFNVPGYRANTNRGTNDKKMPKPWVLYDKSSMRICTDLVAFKEYFVQMMPI